MKLQILENQVTFNIFFNNILESPKGLRDYEGSLLSLIEKITKGTIIQIDSTGTCLRFKPGVIIGGDYLNHDCGLTRGIGYFLEPLIILSLFSKKKTSIKLSGITNHPKEYYFTFNLTF